MPEPSHPPYAATAMFIPRELNRWLDINAQNGPLGRTQTFITLPSFSVSSTWKGYSEIVAAFNFEGPNGFSLKSIGSEISLTPNYCLCISWRDSAGNMYRYALWNGVGEVFYFTVPLYTGQLIKKNFRLEIWNTNSSPSINVASINFYTSVLGIVDYRYGIDTNLVLNDSETTSFGNIDTISPTLPQTIVGAYYNWSALYRLGHSGTTFTGWGNQTDNSKIFVSSGGFTVQPALGGITLATNACYGVNGNTISCDVSSALVTSESVVLNVLIAVGATNSTIYDDSAGNKLAYNTAGTFTLLEGSTPEASVSGIQTSTWYTIIISNGQIFVYIMSSGTLLGYMAGSSSISTTGVIYVGGSDMAILDIIIGANQMFPYLQPQEIADYYSNLYFGTPLFDIPLTFPTNAVSVSN